LAARLSEDPDVRVLLLEAGPSDSSMLIHMPAGFFAMSPEAIGWGYRTAPQRHADGREMSYMQGRVLGGGGSINAQVFVRGQHEDYDRWANEDGCAGWSFAEVQHCFVRMEDNDMLSGPYHGNGGPMGVSTRAPHRLTRAFVQACQQAGIPYTGDFNGSTQEGAGIYQTNTRRGRRCSSAAAYLTPVRGRPNLAVRTGCFTHRVVVEHGRAVGVEYQHDSALRHARAEREVILSGGGIGSPRLLLLSGIGPAEHLRDVGVPVVHDLPGVGQNLHDHYAIDVSYELSGPYGLDRYNRRHWRMVAGLQYYLFRNGPAASTLVEGGAFIRIDPAATAPDTQFHFIAGAGLPEGAPPLPSGNGCMLNSYFLRPLSRGTLTLRSPDPRVPPVIDPNYLAEPEDLRMTVESVYRMREIMHQSAFRPYLWREHLPGDAVNSRSDIEAFVRRYGRTGYHPVGACRMGNGAFAVVDAQLRVRGIEGLRVCDSSIMPSVVSSNTNAPTVMIGERASDFLRGAVAAGTSRPTRQPTAAVLAA
jgi:choline dehydrogenase